MKIAKAVAVLGVLAMASILIYGFTVGDFSGEGKVLLSMPWGIVSLVDVYIGFILFSGWIVYREKSLVRSAMWITLVMILGNFTASLYHQRRDQVVYMPGVGGGFDDHRVGGPQVSRDPARKAGEGYPARTKDHLLLGVDGVPAHSQV